VTDPTEGDRHSIVFDDAYSPSDHRRERVVVERVTGDRGVGLVDPSALREVEERSGRPLEDHPRAAPRFTGKTFTTQFDRKVEIAGHECFAHFIAVFETVSIPKRDAASRPDSGIPGRPYAACRRFTGSGRCRVDSRRAPDGGRWRLGIFAGVARYRGLHRRGRPQGPTKIFTGFVEAAPPGAPESAKTTCR